MELRPREHEAQLPAREGAIKIHRYKRATRELWKFCGSVTGSRAGLIARTLEEMDSRGESIDWWERGTPARDG